MALTVQTLLDGVVLGEGSRKDDVSDSVMSISMSLTMDQVSQIKITVDDPWLSILHKANLSMGSPLDYRGLKLALSVIETIDSPSGAFTLTLRPRVVRALKQRRGTAVSRSLSPSEWVKIEVEAAGGKAVVQDSSSRSQIARDVPPKGEDPGDAYSSWSTISRLAGELGFVVFEAQGTVYFGKPTWLTEGAIVHKVRWLRFDEEPKSGVIGTTKIPICRRSEDDEGRVEVTVALPRDSERKMEVGDAILLESVPGFDGKYLITSINYDIALVEKDIEVTAVTPHDPTPSGKDTSE